MSLEYESSKTTMGGAQFSFSIVIPAYNCEEHIEETVNSVLQQTYPLLEVVIVDDGSTDGTLGKCRTMMAVDRRVKVYSKENGGPLSARIHAYQYVGGDYILHLDSDDLLRKDSLETLIKYIADRNPDVVFFEKTSCKNFESTEKLFDMCDAEIVDRDKKAMYLNHALIDFSLNSMCTKAIKRSLLNKIVYPEEILNIIVGEDLLQSLYILDEAESTVYCGQCLYYYRNNPHGTTMTYRSSDFSDAITCYKYIKVLVDRWQSLHGFSLTIDECERYLLIRIYRVMQGAWAAGDKKSRFEVIEKAISNQEIQNCLKDKRIRTKLRLDMRLIYDMIEKGRTRHAAIMMSIFEMLRNR